MDTQSIKTMRIMEEIDNNKALSQRELSRTLNISLGLVNSFIKRLSRKGYIKITTIPKNKIKYFLTPKGIAEKSRLTYEYIRFSYQFYKKASLKLNNLFNQLAGDGLSRLVFYGADDFAEIAYFCIKDKPLDVIAVVDDQKAGQDFFGSTIKKSSSLISMRFDRIIITCDDPGLFSLGNIPREKIVTFE